MNTPIYNSFDEKAARFKNNFKIDKIDELDEMINALQKDNNNLYRGINTATYKLYSSSQVQWMLSNAINTKDVDAYYKFIVDCIDVIRKDDTVKHYIDSINFDNDLYVLALMQHFGIPTPMIDFSHSILNALFFAYDKSNMNISGTQDQLSDYISIYVISRNIDWINCSAQYVMQNSAEQLNTRLKANNLFAAGRLDVRDVIYDFIKIPYENFKDWSFIAVDDNPNTSVEVNIPVVKFSCKYQIINDRILSQQGMFIANNSVDTPLVELMNEKCNNKFFDCYNIHKNLLEYIKKTYLVKNGVDEKMIYCKNNSNANKLEEVMNMLKDRILRLMQELYLRFILILTYCTYLSPPYILKLNLSFCLESVERLTWNMIIR